MISARAALTGSYNDLQVVLSALIAVAASYAALDLAGRVTAASGRIRSAWLIGGAGAMGLGIWSMHFVGMLAFSLPVPVSYNLPLVLVSLLVGILCSAFALYVVSRHRLGISRALAGSVLMGAGIAGLHYIGMDAMRMSAECRFDLRLVALSILLAILFSLAALLLAFHQCEETRGTPSRKTASALGMGAAITAMHYTGMAAAHFTASPVAPDLSHAVSVSELGTTGIGIVTLIVLGIAILTSAADRRISALAKTLEQRVAERARTEQSLRLFRMLIDQSNDAIEVIDPETLRYIDVNGKACLDLGYSREELLSLSVFDIDPSVDEAKVAKVRSELQDAGSGIFESFHRRKDGSTFPVEVSVKQVRVDRLYFVSVARDITERKRAEEALRESEEMLRLAAQAGRMFAYEWDAASDVIVRSAEAPKILGIAGTALMTGQQALAATYPDDRERVIALVAQLTREKPDLRISYRLVRPDGSVIWIERNSRAHFDEQGRMLRVVGMIADITETKRAEQSLQETQAELAHVTRALAMGELVATIAHEVYQPLTAVLTTSSFVQRQLTSNIPNLKALQDAMAEIVQDGNRIRAIISRIRTLFTKDAPDRVELDMNEVIQEVTVLVRSEAARNHVQFKLNLADHLPLIIGDRVQLQQVLINLILNGIAAMRTVTDRPRNLDISSAKHGDGVLVRVQDCGIGVDPNNLQRIFEPFFTTKRQGIGIGLSISRSIIESHGGRLWAEPSSSGAIFQFIVPSTGGRGI
jgi:PAS domain S-box-containing protein